MLLQCAAAAAVVAYVVRSRTPPMMMMRRGAMGGKVGKGKQSADHPCLKRKSVTSICRTIGSAFE